MRKVMALILVLSISMLPACSSLRTQYAAGGAGIGGMVGGLVGMAFPNSSVGGVAALGGAALGGVAGYLLGGNAEKKELEAQQQEEQQRQAIAAQQYQAQQLQQLQAKTQLSAVVAVVNLRKEGYRAANGAELASILTTKVNPGEQFAIHTKKENATAVAADMVKNGYTPIASPKREADRMVFFYQKSNGQLNPVSLDQVSKLL